VEVFVVFDFRTVLNFVLLIEVSKHNIFFLWVLSHLTNHVHGFMHVFNHFLFVFLYPFASILNESRQVLQLLLLMIVSLLTCSHDFFHSFDVGLIFLFLDLTLNTVL